MPRSYVRKKEPKYTALDLRHALDLIREGRTAMAVANSTGISYRTLMRYKNGHGVVRDVPGYVTDNYVFTDDEESRLKDYFCTLSAMFYGLSAVEARRLAFEYAERMEKRMPKKWKETRIAGGDWLRAFLRRGQLSLITPEAASINRAKGFNRQAVEAFHENLATVIRTLKIKMGRILNLDEAGFTNVNSCQKVLAPTGRKQVSQMTASERGKLVTAVGIICDDGKTIPPVFVFPRKGDALERVLVGSPRGSKGTNNDSGWMTTEIFAEVVLPHIIEHAKPTSDDPVLLIVDNHSSHISLSAVDTCRDNNVVLLTIPPHTSHKLQPLDVAIYGPFKSMYDRALQDWMDDHEGNRPTLGDLCGVFSTAYDASFTRRNILAGFEKTGISPLNRNVFTDDDFLQAEAHLPLLVGHYVGQPRADNGGRPGDQLVAEDDGHLDQRTADEDGRPGQSTVTNSGQLG